MKANLFSTLALATALSTLTAAAQDNPIRTLPPPADGVPDIAEPPPPPPVPLPPGLPPGVEIDGPDIDPDMPDGGWAEPGFPGEMIMPDMPGRFRIHSVQLLLNGKATPVVLKLDTMTGQTWQLKLTEQKFFFNGKAHSRTQLAFELVGQGRAPVHEHGRENAPVPLPGREVAPVAPGTVPIIPAPSQADPAAPEEAPDTSPARPRFRLPFLRPKSPRQPAPPIDRDEN